MVIYNPELAIVAVVHVLFGVAWVGVHVANEIILTPEIKKAKALKDMPVFKSSAKRISIVGMILGFGTLISGLVYLLTKFGTNFDTILADPESRTVFGAMWVVIFVLVAGMAVLRPSAMKLGKQAAQMDPTAPLPEDFHKQLHRLELFLHLSSGGVFLTLVLMVLATQGGI